MPQPAGCPAAVYSVMRSCWESDAATRPRFAVLAETLSKLVDDPNAVEETDLDAAYLQVTSGDSENNYEVPVANGGGGSDDGGGDDDAPTEYSLATQEVCEDYTVPVALSNPEAGSRASVALAAGEEGDYDAGTIATEDFTEDSALYEMATQEPKHANPQASDTEDEDGTVYELATQESEHKGSAPVYQPIEDVENGADEDEDEEGYTAPVTLGKAEVGSRAWGVEQVLAAMSSHDSAAVSGAGAGAGAAAGSSIRAEAFALFPQTSSNDAAAAQSTSTVSSKRPPRPTSTAPSPAIAAAVGAAVTKRPPRPTSVAPTPALSAAIAKSLAASSTAAVGRETKQRPPRPTSIAPSPAVTAAIRAATMLPAPVALPAPVRLPVLVSTPAPVSIPAPALAPVRSPVPPPPAQVPAPVPTRRSSRGGGAPTPARRPSSIVAVGGVDGVDGGVRGNDSTTNRTVATANVTHSDASAPKVKVKVGPKPRPRSSVNVNVPTTMSGDDVWDMSADAGELSGGFLPAVCASKLLKRTTLSNDTLKIIWNKSKSSADSNVPSNMMSQQEFVRAYGLALTAGGIPIQSVSNV